MAAHYTELHGAFGREAVYRPQRYKSRDLLSTQARPRLRLGDVEHPVVDISMSGIAILLSDRDVPMTTGAELHGALLVNGAATQQIRVRVVRTEESARGLRVGFSVTQGFIDLDALREIDARATLEHQLQTGPLAQGAMVPASFRSVVAEAVHVVQFYRLSLEPYEASARERGESAVRELAHQAHRGLAPIYAELRERASEAAEPFLGRPEIMDAAKQYAETVLTPLLLPSPMIWRSYMKPLGYAGDYQVMLYYYANEFEGDTAFAKLFHKLFVEHPLSAGVCTRKDYVVDSLGCEFARMRAASPDAAFTVTSLGCGPAKEIADFAANHASWPGVIHFRLIDQEERTLQVAYEGAKRSLALRDSHSVLECLNLSFGQLLKTPALLERGGPQHFIYSTGLFDYLASATAQQLIAALYSCLAPGGRMLIGNAKGPNKHFFCPEFVLDWSLVYRTKEEMLALAQALPPGARVDVELEPGGAYWFLKIQRP